MLDKLQQRIENTAFELFQLNESRVVVPDDVKDELQRIKYIREHHSEEWNRLYMKISSLIVEFYSKDEQKRNFVFGKNVEDTGHNVELILTVLKCLNAFKNDYNQQNFNWENKAFLKYFNSAFFKEAKKSDIENKQKEKHGGIYIPPDYEKIQSDYEDFRENLYKAGKIKTFNTDCLEQFCATHTYKHKTEKDIKCILGMNLSASELNSSEDSGFSETSIQESEDIFADFRKNNDEILKQIFMIFEEVGKEKGYSEWDKAVLTHWVLTETDILSSSGKKGIIVGNTIEYLKKSTFFSENVFNQQASMTGRDLERAYGYAKSFYSKTRQRLFSRVRKIIASKAAYNILLSGQKASQSYEQLAAKQ